jgi:hypothetical protein
MAVDRDPKAIKIANHWQGIVDESTSGIKLVSKLGKFSQLLNLVKQAKEANQLPTEYIYQMQIWRGSVHMEIMAFSSFNGSWCELNASARYMRVTMYK